MQLAYDTGIKELLSLRIGEAEFSVFVDYFGSGGNSYFGAVDLNVNRFGPSSVIYTSGSTQNWSYFDEVLPRKVWQAILAVYETNR